jgi:hypothetical protein
MIHFFCLSLAALLAFKAQYSGGNAALLSTWLPNVHPCSYVDPFCALCPVDATPAMCGTSVRFAVTGSLPRAYCNFQGITCSATTQGVTVLNLTNSGLRFNKLPVELGLLNELTDIRKMSDRVFKITDAGAAVESQRTSQP